MLDLPIILGKYSKDDNERGNRDDEDDDDNLA